MAETVQLLELDWDIDAAIANGAKFEKQAIAIKTEIKDLKQQFKDGAISTDNYSKEFTKLNSSLKTVQKEQRTSTKVIQAYSDQQNKSINIIKQTDGSINQLQAALAKNRSLYRDLTKEQRDNEQIGGVLLKTIEEQDEQYKELQTSIGVTAVNVGDYRNQLEQLVPGFGGATGAFQKFFTLTKAFIASPIGLIIGALGLALGALTSYFTGTERGAQKFRVIMATLEGVMGTLKDVAIGLGEGLFNAFSSPQDAIDSLVENVRYVFIEFIPNAINKVLDGFSLLGTAVKRLFEGDFSGAADAALEGIVKLGDGITDLNPVTAVLKNISDELVIIGEEAIRDARAAGQLADQMNRIKVAERELALERARANKDIARYKLIAEDVNELDEVRIDAAQRAFKIENDLLQQEIKLQQMRINNIAAQNALSESTEEDIQSEYDARIALANLEQASFQKQVEINNKLNSLTKERLAKEEKLEEDKRKRDEERRLIEEEEQAIREAIEFEELINRLATEEEIKMASLERQKELEIQAARDSIKNDELFERKKAVIVQKYEKDKAELRRMNAEQEVQLASETFMAIGNLVGQNTVLGRLAGSALATIDAYVAANKALASAPPPLGQILSVATLAKGLANVARINSTNTNMPSISGPRGFATGGRIGGNDMAIPTQPNGDNVLITAKRGEVVLNERQQMALGGRRTFSSIGVPGFARGGLIGSISPTQAGGFSIEELTTGLTEAVKNIPPGIVLVEDVNTGQARVAQVESEANI